ncbi:hypothetical protein N0V90_004663 [Kalmusia sp. IMI 367209]|nr:hypothetical protein N0V90_004663 [Kalmusia sp. IMI 367209]
MALAQPAKKFDMSRVLTALEPLGADSYLIAFGPGRAQFCGTPNGYSTAQLPSKVIKDLLYSRINKVLWASFGSDANSFFFTYEMKDGSVAHRAGKAIPITLRSFVEHASTTSIELASSLRVQLGVDGSYVAWAGSIWTCCKVPSALRNALHRLSSTHNVDGSGSQGELKSGTLENVAWHGNGSCYVKSGCKHFFEFETTAYVTINPHSPTGNTFAFFKKARHGEESEFILRFEPEDVVSRLYDKHTVPGYIGYEKHAVDFIVPKTTSNEYGRVVNIPKNDKGQQVFRWAISKRAGRSHATDSWELDLKKGERIKVLQDMGKDWFLAEKQSGLIGWVPGAWLDFKEMKPHVDPREAYARFKTDIEKLFKVGTLRSFPSLSKYMNACGKEACKPLKQDKDSLGVCIHDLHELMRGSGCYSSETLRGERNKWHPDKFARFCHPEHRDGLRERAQTLFVLFGVLMDWLENPPAGENVV